jgi:hypothetical protein
MNVELSNKELTLMLDALAEYNKPLSVTYSLFTKLLAVVDNMNNAELLAARDARAGLRAVPSTQPSEGQRDPGGDNGPGQQG